ncbi:hypothetical protein [Natronospora cellulosivora (SeqCode)]
MGLIKKKVREKSLDIPGKSVWITFTDYGKKVGAIGAATMVLEEIFKVEE